MTNNNKTLIKIDRSVTFDNPAYTQIEDKYNIYLVGNAALVVGCEMAGTTISSDENMFMIAEITTGDDGKKAQTDWPAREGQGFSVQKNSCPGSAPSTVWAMKYRNPC